MGSMRHLLVLTMLLQMVSLTAQTDERSLAVGDTVVLKARHRSTGVVLAFLGHGLCPPCVSALSDIDRRLAGTRLPIEVYVGDGLESSAAATVKQHVSHAKLYDDETYAVAQQYRVFRYPTFAFVSPSGVVRGVISPGVKGAENSHVAPVIDAILKEGSFLEYRGPVQQRATVAKSIELPKEVYVRGGDYLHVFFDPQHQQFFCWSVRSSTTAYVLDTSGRIVRTYDMTAAAVTQAPSRVDVKAWDNQRERVLLSSNAGGSQNNTLCWFGLRSLTVDTLKYELSVILQGSQMAYHPATSSYASTIHLPYVLEGKSGDDFTVFVQTATGTSRIVPKSSLYARDSMNTSMLYSTLTSCPGGFLTSQVLADTVHYISASDRSVKAFHVPLPQPYYVPHTYGMKQYRTVPGAYRSGITFYSEMIGMLADEARPDYFMCKFIIPSKVLDNVERRPFFDKAYIMVDFNMKKNGIERSFELPQETNPIAVHDGAVICRQFDLNPPQITWFVGPTVGSPNK